jgi:hypothetical protein
MKNRPFSILHFLVLITLIQACQYEKLPVPVICDQIAIEVTALEKASCNVSDGSFELNATGGNPPYSYQLGSGDFQLSPFFSDLKAGSYNLTVVDLNNCTETLDVIIDNRDGVNMQLSSTDAGCMTTNGSITITAVNGTSPYSFSINGGDLQSENIFDNLARGDYTVLALDAMGCETSQTTNIKSGISFANSISSIIQTNCAVSGCHSGSQFPDFRVFSNIQNNASQIKSRTASRNMPQGRTLSQANIDAIGCWVDDGAKNN